MPKTKEQKRIEAYGRQHRGALLSLLRNIYSLYPKGHRRVLLDKDEYSEQHIYSNIRFNLESMANAMTCSRELRDYADTIIEQFAAGACSIKYLARVVLFPKMLQFAQEASLLNDGEDQKTVLLSEGESFVDDFLLWLAKRK